MRLIPEQNPLTRHLAFVYFSLGLLGLLLLRCFAPLITRLAFCPLRDHLGVPCPACGSTHAAQAFLRGDFSTAGQENPLFLLACCGLALWLFYALVATLVPTWRREVRLGKVGKRALRLVVGAILVAGWAFQICRLT